MTATLSLGKVLPESNSGWVESGGVDSSLQKAISKAKIGISRDLRARQFAFESLNDIKCALFGLAGDLELAPPPPHTHSLYSL